MANRSIRDSRTSGPSFLSAPLMGAPNQVQAAPQVQRTAGFQPVAPVMPRPAPTLAPGPPAVAATPGAIARPAPQVAVARPPLPPAPIPGASGPGTGNPGMATGQPINTAQRR